MNQNQVNTRSLAVHFASLILLFFMTACGGGGGGGSSNNNNNNPPPGNGNGNVAPSAVSERILLLNIPMEPSRQVRLEDGTRWTELQNNAQLQGNYIYQRQADGRSASLTLHQEGGTNASVALAMTFTSSTEGTFTFTSGRAGQGTFRLDALQNPGDGGNGGNGGNNPPPTGLAPASLDGKRMFGTRTFTSTGPVGQTHQYVFTGATFHDSDPPEEATGVFQWAPNGDAGQLTLDYTSPEGFAGDKHVLQMQFASATQGNFESLYTRRDGTTIVINGVFEFR